MSLILSEPVTEPLADGENRTEIVQFLPGATGAVQVLVWLKPALAEMLATLNDAVPVLLRVTVLAELVVPRRCLPKLRLVGVTAPTAAPGVGVGRAVAVGFGVAVAVAVLGIGVEVAVGFGVAVGVEVAVGFGVALGLAVAVRVGVGVPALVGVGVGALLPKVSTVTE